MAISMKYAQMGRTPSAHVGNSAQGRNAASRVSLRALLFGLFIAAVVLDGCHHNPSKSLTVSLDPSTTQSLDAGHSLNFIFVVLWPWGRINSRLGHWPVIPRCSRLRL